MKFVLEVDLNAGVIPGHELAELGRILRYWAGNLKYYELAPGSGETLSDSTYAPVGTWKYTD